MIENKTIYGTGNSANNARNDCAKKIAEYFCENCTQATIYQEYQDGCVIKINDNNIYFGIYGVAYDSQNIAIASLKQTNESLSEDCESLSLLTDFTSVKTLDAYQVKASTITTSLYRASALITLLSNEEDILLLNGQKFIAGVIQDENDINYIAIGNVANSSANFADAVFYNNDISYSSWLPLSSTRILGRNNANEIFKVNMLNSAGYKFKKVYNILPSNNISAGSRYKINGDEYYALTTVILFRLEGSE